MRKKDVYTDMRDLEDRDLLKFYMLRFGISYGEPAEYNIHSNLASRSGVWLKLGFRVIVR